MSQSCVPMLVQSTAGTRECDCLAHRFGNSADNALHERRYPTDMTDAGWAVVRPLLPAPGWMRGRGGQPEAYCHRAMLDQCREVRACGLLTRRLDLCGDGDSCRVGEVVEVVEGG
ncbi:transposase, partial [Streptomyces shenzhenensis]